MLHVIILISFHYWDAAQCPQSMYTPQSAKRLKQFNVCKTCFAMFCHGPCLCAVYCGYQCLILGQAFRGFPPSCWFPQKLQYSDQDLTSAMATDINWPVCLCLNSCSCLRGSGWIWHDLASNSCTSTTKSCQWLHLTFWENWLTASPRLLL